MRYESLEADPIGELRDDVRGPSTCRDFAAAEPADAASTWRSIRDYEKNRFAEIEPPLERAKSPAAGGGALTSGDIASLSWSSS